MLTAREFLELLEQYRSVRSVTINTKYSHHEVRRAYTQAIREGLIDPLPDKPSYSEEDLVVAVRMPVLGKVR